jgi:hypothetical protein
MQRVGEPYPACGNALLWWRSRTGQRVCMVCHPDPLQALQWLGAQVLEPARPMTERPQT